MAAGLNQLNDGIMKLDSSTKELKDGSDQYMAAFEEFRSGLSEYKAKGIDEIANKTSEVNEISQILDEMSKLAKENNSITGTSDDFETRSRIIQKIK